MKRGTRVGQAYVALAVDGTGINEEIADELDQIGPEADRAGDEAGDRYGGKFSDRFRGRMDEMREKVAGRLNKSFAKSGDESGKEFSDNFEKHFGSEFLNRLGAHIGGHVVDALNFALSKEGGENPLGDLVDMWEKSSRRDVENAGHNIGDNLGESIAERLELSFAGMLDSLENQLATLNVSGNRGGGGGRNDDRGLGDRVGSLFGAGSRNNFLNLFGKSLGGLVGITEKVGKSAGAMFKTFVDGAKNAEESVGFLRGGFGALLKGGEAGGGIAKAFGSIAKSGPAAAAAVAVVAAALSALASVLSALLAIVTALASTITSALVGALAVLAPAILAVVAAGGLLVNLFTSLTDAQFDKMKDAFTPLKETLTGIGQIMAGPVVEAFDTWAKNLQTALGLLIPLASVMGNAFAQAGNILTASFSGPGFQQFITALTGSLPQITKSLSGALGGFLNGLLSTFAALMPYVVQFADYLERTAKRFAEWASSSEGQNSIVDFVGRALESLHSLWDAVREFGGFLASVLFSREAQEAGNSMFDGLARTFRDMADQIRRWADDGTLKQWFEDGKKLASALADILKAVLKAFNALSNSGVLSVIAKGFEAMAVSISLAADGFERWKDLLGVTLKPLTGSINAILHPIETLKGAPDRAKKAFDTMGNFLTGKWTNDLREAGDGTTALGRQIQHMAGVALTSLSSLGRGAANIFSGIKGVITGIVDGVKGSMQNVATNITTGIGSDALDATSEDRGGRIPKDWKNPYKAWAESLIKDGPSTAAQIKAAVTAANRAAVLAIREASKSSDLDAVRTSMQEQAKTLVDAGKSVVETAQNALNSAAQSLASATSASEARRALAEVRRAQKDLDKAIKEQNRLKKAAALVSAQQFVNTANVAKLLDGLKVQNATLADFARARELLAIKIEKAQDKLSEAISLRDNFVTQTADSIKAYGSLVSAQAQTLNGVQQALTASDVIGNLQSRLDKIQQFQDMLRMLAAQGLSDEAYKQLVSAGVEGGFDTAQALLAGGTGAIQQVNDLIGKIGAAGDSLGQTAGDKLYQAGVDAAQGLLDGLTSLDDKLEAAAFSLGTRIANQIKAALGIKSPSTVLIAAMDEVGNGGVIGLDNQHGKISAAGRRFGDTITDAISVTPQAAAYDMAQRAAGVSGNTDSGQRFRDLIVQTPTEDPRAVALETMTEVLGRI